MSLHATQNFLARIYTDEKLRGEFLSAPGTVGLENALNEREIRELIEILPAEIDFFAESLLWKRIREAEKFLPLIKKFLAADFEKFFREFARDFTPESNKKHLEDAVNFAEFLQINKSNSPIIKDLAKYEKARLLFYNYNKSFILESFDYELRKLNQLNGLANIKQIPMKKTFGVWFRFGNFARHFLW